MKYPTNAAVIHAWAHGLSEEGQNPNRTIFFEEQVIYSYGHHFPMAKIVDGLGVLVTLDSYSNTTAKQMSHVGRAVGHLACFYVHDVLHPFDMLEETLEEVHAHLASAGRRKQEWGREYDIKTADKRLADLEFLSRSGFYSPEWDKVKEHQRQQMRQTRELVDQVKLNTEQALANLNEQGKEQRKQDQARRREERKKIKEDAELFMAAWLSNLHVPGLTMGGLKVLGYDGLRLSMTHPGEVETTQGLRVPADDCRKAWPLIKAALQRGEELTITVARPRFGGFQLSRIEKDGTVVVGCHTFPREIIERLAAQLGLS